MTSSEDPPQNVHKSAKYVEKHSPELFQRIKTHESYGVHQAPNHYYIAGMILWQYDNRGQTVFTVAEVADMLDTAGDKERIRSRLNDLTECDLIAVIDKGDREYQYELTDTFIMDQPVANESQRILIGGDRLNQFVASLATIAPPWINACMDTMASSIQDQKISRVEQCIDTITPELPPPSQRHLDRISRQWAIMSFFGVMASSLYVHLSPELSLYVLKILVAVVLFCLSVSTVTAVAGFAQQWDLRDVVQA